MIDTDFKREVNHGTRHTNALQPSIAPTETTDIPSVANAQTNIDAHQFYPLLATPLHFNDLRSPSSPGCQTSILDYRALSENTESTSPKEIHQQFADMMSALFN